MRIHDIKCDEPFYSSVLTGKKSFELRKDDRNYQVGDYLHLQKTKDGEVIDVTENLVAEIIYKLTGYEGLADGYCMLGIRVRDICT